ncbi:condensation domain-containing protein, partial [Bacillus altitudinis]
VEEVQPERSTSHSPLFQTMFTINNEEKDLLNIDDLNIRGLDFLQNSFAKFDLTVAMERRKEGLITAFEYNTDLFDKSTVERMANHFKYWL